MVDLFVIGLYNGTATVAAVSIGSQVMHMLTVMIVGLAMGATVRIGFAVGQKDQERAAKTIGNSVTFFACFALICMVLLLICTNGIAGLMQTAAGVDEGDDPISSNLFCRNSLCRSLQCDQFYFSRKR